MYLQQPTKPFDFPPNHFPHLLSYTSNTTVLKFFEVHTLYHGIYVFFCVQFLLQNTGMDKRIIHIAAWWHVVSFFTIKKNHWIKGSSKYYFLVPKLREKCLPLSIMKVSGLLEISFVKKRTFSSVCNSLKDFLINELDFILSLNLDISIHFCFFPC